MRLGLEPWGLGPSDVQLPGVPSQGRDVRRCGHIMSYAHARARKSAPWCSAVAVANQVTRGGSIISIDKEKRGKPVSIPTLLPAAGCKQLFSLQRTDRRVLCFACADNPPARARVSPHAWRERPRLPFHSSGTIARGVDVDDRYQDGCKCTAVTREERRAEQTTTVTTPQHGTLHRHSVERVLHHGYQVQKKQASPDPPKQ